jgi:hypothetical protein
MKQAVQVYSFGNLIWQSVQGLPLVLFPKFIHSLLRGDGEVATGAY